MPRRKQSRGKCTYCGEEFTKGRVFRHLEACFERLKAIEASDNKLGTTETLYHLRVQDSWQSDFWLDLEVRGSATLQELDRYLRAIWLECCGHLSQFSMGGQMNSIGVTGLAQVHLIASPGDFMPAAEPGFLVVGRFDALMGRW